MEANHTEKWRFEYSQLPVYEVSLDITHSDCVITELSRRLNQELDIGIPTDPLENGTVHAYCMIPQSLARAEISNLFKTFNGNLKRATIYAPPREPIMFDLRFRDEPMEILFQSRGSTVEHYRASPQLESVQMKLRGTQPNDLLSKLEKFGTVDIHHIRKGISPEMGQSTILTSKEIYLLQNMIDWGYFSLPTREITLQSAANRLAMSDSQLSLEVRNIANKVFKEYLRHSIRLERP